MLAPLAETSAITSHFSAALPSAAAGAVRMFAFLEGIGAMEMMLVAIIGLLLFGGKGLPDMARTVGKVIREFKKATQGVEDEVRRVMHEEPEPARPARPPRPRPRPQALAASPAPQPALTPTPAPTSVPRSDSSSGGTGGGGDGSPAPSSPSFAPPPRVAPPSPPAGSDPLPPAA